MYTTDLETFTCSCPDWQKRRSHYEGLDFRRLCKHLVEDLYNGGASAKNPAVEDIFYDLDYFMEERLLEYPEHEDEECEDLEEDEPLYNGFPLGQLCRTSAGWVLFNKESSWTHIFHEGHPYLYNLEEDRFVFGDNLVDKQYDFYRQLISMAYDGQSIEGNLETRIPGD